MSGAGAPEPKRKRRSGRPRKRARLPEPRDELGGGTEHEPAIWQNVLDQAPAAEEHANGPAEPVQPDAQEGQAPAPPEVPAVTSEARRQLATEPRVSARRGREAAASIAIMRLHAPSANELANIAHDTAAARAVLEAVPSAKFAELAAAGGLLAHLEQTHGPGTYRAVWIAKDLHTLSSETVVVPDVATVARELAEEARQAAEDEARAVQEERLARSQAAQEADRREWRGAFLRFWLPQLPMLASALPPADRGDAIDGAESWLRTNADWLLTQHPDWVGHALMVMLAGRGGP